MPVLAMALCVTHLGAVESNNNNNYEVIPQRSIPRTHEAPDTTQNITLHETSHCPTTAAQAWYLDTSPNDETFFRVPAAQAWYLDTNPNDEAFFRVPAAQAWYLDTIPSDEDFYGVTALGDEKSGGVVTLHEIASHLCIVAAASVRNRMAHMGQKVGSVITQGMQKIIQAISGKTTGPRPAVDEESLQEQATTEIVIPESLSLLLAQADPSRITEGSFSGPRNDEIGRIPFGLYTTQWTNKNAEKQQQDEAENIEQTEQQNKIITFIIWTIYTLTNMPPLDMRT